MEHHVKATDPYTCDVTLKKSKPSGHYHHNNPQQTPGFYGGALEIKTPSRLRGQEFLFQVHPHKNPTGFYFGLLCTVMEK